jgi:hypothetical protein
MVEPCSDDFDGAISVVSEYSRKGARRTANWIAECDLQDDRVEENHANARLIAAAPELLAACQGALEEFSEWEGPEEDVPAEQYAASARARNKAVRAYEAIRAAVAKAEGGA